MFTISTLFLFIGAVVLLILIPGPDLIFAVTQGMANGRKAGVYTAAGLALENTVHTLAAALGLSIIVTTSPVILRYLRLPGRFICSNWLINP